MHHIDILYAKDIDLGNKTFTFCFKDLDDYTIIVTLDYYNEVWSQDFARIKEVTRLLTAMNLFRQWEKESYYCPVELRKALIEIANKNDKKGKNSGFYQFALLGTKKKDWNKIIIEKP